MWDGFGFTREHVESVLTTRQVELYVHLAFRKIERDANIHAAAISRAAIEILNAIFK